jgi:hypothetical protein
MGIVLSFFVELPSRSFSFVPLGSQLTLTLSGPWMVAGILMVLAITGMDSILRSYSRARGLRLWHLLPYAALPMLLTGTGTLLVHLLSDYLRWPISLALVGMLLYLVSAAECATFEGQTPRLNLIHLGLNAVNLAIAFILYSAIYQGKARSLESATAILLVTFPLALDMLKGRGGRSWLYSAIIALALGEMTWALNYCGLSGPAGGGLLALSFYLMGGPLQQHLASTLRRRVGIEFALVGVAILAVLIATIPLAW